MQIVPALATCVVVFGVPESPRWLAQKGRSDEVVHTLCYVFDLPGDDPYIIRERDAIFNAISLEDAGRFRLKALFVKDAIRTNYRVLLSFLVLFMNQVRQLHAHNSVTDSTAVDGNQRDCLLCTDSPGTERWPGKDHGIGCQRMHPVLLCCWLYPACMGSRQDWTQKAPDVRVVGNGPVDDDGCYIALVSWHEDAEANIPGLHCFFHNSWFHRFYCIFVFELIRDSSCSSLVPVFALFPGVTAPRSYR